MAECIKQTEESKMEGLLREGVHKITKLDDDLFNHYLAFLDVLIERQVERGQYQDSLE